MKKITKFLAPMLSAVCLLGTLPFAACSGTSAGAGGGGTNEDIDHSRTQIYVFNYAGGYGSDWLAEIKKRFEAEHANESYEDGKKGVQVYVNPIKTGFSSMTSSILTGSDEVFFGEAGYYNTLLKSGLLADISDAVTDTLDEYGETRSIEDKLTKEQKEYYGVKGQDGKTHYYALPHYTSNFGFIYNVDLFDDLGYYVKKGTEGANPQFIKKDDGKVSKGPDGRTGVIDGVDYSEDDGLPATYDEFFALCDQMVDDGVIPVTWGGIAYGAYLNNMRLALASEAMGLEEMMLNYKLNGTAKTLATANVDGTLNFLGEESIVPANAYKLAQQSGWYYALSFLERLTMTDDYHYSLAFNTGYSHMDAQEDFINAGLDGKTKEIGMLMDGTWWEAEATSAYNRMVQSKGESYSKMNRNFKMMPIPKPTQAHVDAAANSGKKQVYTSYDENAPLCFVKSNVAEWKLPLIKEFMKFCHTDVSLREYTRVTNSLRSFDYTLTESDLSNMTTFGKSLVSLKVKSDIVFPYSNDPGYTVNEAAYTSGAYLAKSIVGGKSYSGWYTAFSDSSITPVQYFNGLITYSTQNPIISISGTPAV